MAIGKASDFKIYDPQFQAGYTETIQQETDAFNGASAGAIRLVAVTRAGHFAKEAFFAALDGLDQRRDITSTADVDPMKLTQGELVGVKLNRRVGPVEHTIDAFRKAGIDPRNFSFVIGQQAAKAIAAGYLNRALIAAVAALEGQAPNTHAATGGTLAYAAIPQAMAKFGDMFGSLRAMVMHSKPFFDLYGDGMASYKIENVAGAMIVGGVAATMGKPLVVTDSPALLEADGVSGGVDAYRTLLLTENAVTVEESEDMTIHDDVIGAKENLVMQFQAEYAFNLGLKGFAWDVANGGANPTDGALGTSTNWDKVATSHKSLAGVVLRTR